MRGVLACSRGLTNVYRLNKLSLPAACGTRGRSLGLFQQQTSSRLQPVAAMHTFQDAPFEPPQLPSFQAATAQEARPELLLIATCEEDFTKADDKVTLNAGALEGYSEVVMDTLSDVVGAGGFEGRQGQQSKILRVGGSATDPKYVGLLGLGKQDKVATVPSWGPPPYQAAGAAAAAMCIVHKAEAVSVAFPRAPTTKDAGAFAKGLMAASFVATRFKSKVPDPFKLAAVTLLADLPKEELAAEVKLAEAAARGSQLTRLLVEAPPNVCTPTHLADAAAYIAGKYPDVMKLRVYEQEECQAMGMGAFLGVSECSAEPPRFIHLVYTPPGGADKKVAICGKGVTFDTGGYNLKVGPGSMMDLMKFDMGGAAATLGAANFVGAARPSGVEVHFIVAACENMVDGKGLRPGDVLTAASGKTIEVNNTDAEGRLTLADAVWFAQEKAGATTVVDVATLTGAAIVALGTEIAALFTDSEELSASLTGASKSAGEKLWRLPLEGAYMEMLKSAVADMKNTGSRWGGAITGALFIKEFVEEGTEWAHIDLAGPVWNEKLGIPTGYGAMTLGEWVIQLGQKKE